MFNSGKGEPIVLQAPDESWCVDGIGSDIPDSPVVTYFFTDICWLAIVVWLLAKVRRGGNRHEAERRQGCIVEDHMQGHVLDLVWK